MSHERPTERRGIFGTLGREASLFGAKAIAAVVICLGLTGLAVVGGMRRGFEAKTLEAGGFFVLCGLAGVAMGLERRAALTGKPAPWHGFFRRLSPLRYHATRDGLLMTGRRQAVLYRWSSVAAVSRGECYGNPLVLVSLAAGTPGDLLRSRARRPEAEHRWRQRQLRSQAIVRALYGAELAIFSMQTPEGPGPLHDQIAAVMVAPAAANSLPPATDLV